MFQRPIIYTYGHTHITDENLIPILHRFHINCVVDFRPPVFSNTTLNTPSKDLSVKLKEEQIAYLPFFQHFGVAPKEALNKGGNIVYEKMIQTSAFIEGVGRLENGVRKGFIICIIDGEPDTTKSKRFLILGRYFKDKLDIVHIGIKGDCASQLQVEQQIQHSAELRQKRNLESQKIGEEGEKLAAQYLQDNGFRILDQNWNLHRGCELDIVATKNQQLHFIEVKTRAVKYQGQNTATINPEIAIDYKKLKHIAKAVQAYRYQNGLLRMNYQLDSIAIIYHNPDDYELHHYLDISTPNHSCKEVIYKSIEVSHVLNFFS